MAKERMSAEYLEIVRKAGDRLQAKEDGWNPILDEHGDAVGWIHLPKTKCDLHEILPYLFPNLGRKRADC